LDRFRLRGVSHNPKNIWWGSEFGAAAINTTIALLRKSIADGLNSKLARAWQRYTEEVVDGFGVLAMASVWGTADWYFVPAQNFTVFYQLAELMFDGRVFHEIAVPKIGAGLKWLNIYSTGDLDLPSGLHVWHKRYHWSDLYNANLLYYHPIKPSPFGKNLRKRREFCRTVVTSFRDNLWNPWNEQTINPNYKEGSQIYHLLNSSEICAEPSFSISAYFNCRIQNADGKILEETPENFTLATHTSNTTLYKQNNEDFEQPESNTELLPQNVSGSSLSDWPEEEERDLKRKQYLKCMEFMYHVVNCYKNINYRSYFVDYFQGLKDPEEFWENERGEVSQNFTTSSLPVTQGLA
uniref:Ldi domain-containing protein n=1 Tax=Gongylonema pulchrum TaxID=637853 RepID=A0A183DSK5_9BILA